MPGQLPEVALGLALLTLLAHAAWTDIRERRIANATCLAIVALWPIFLAVSSAPVRPIGSLQVALTIFGMGAILWGRGWLGGGDVKLLAAVALWAGPTHVVPFLIYTTLAGGLLSLLMLGYARAGLALLLPLQAVAVRVGLPLGARHLPLEPAATPSLPYAVAVAMGGGITGIGLLTG